MKNPLMFKPMASPNKAQGLPAGPRPYGVGVTNPLSAEGQGRQMITNMEASGLPWMQTLAGAAPVPLGAGSPPRGGGGGGSFRMGPRPPRQRTMRLGPRTAEEFYAENPGLPPLPTPGSQTPATVPSAVPGGDPNAAPAGFLDEATKLAWDDQTGRVPKPAMMAKGGKMPKGKPVLVGEKGPELILPRDDGTGFVLPADVTQDVLPMMMRDATPRKNGGKIAYRAEGGPVPYEVLQTPSGSFHGVAGLYGTGFGSSRPLPGQGNKLTGAPAITPFMADPSGRYQLDRTAPGVQSQVTVVADEPYVLDVRQHDFSRVSNRPPAHLLFRGRRGTECLRAGNRQEAMNGLARSTKRLHTGDLPFVLRHGRTARAVCHEKVGTMFDRSLPGGRVPC